MTHSPNIKAYIASLVKESVEEALRNTGQPMLASSGRRKLVVANWKMNMSLHEITDFVEKLEAPAVNGNSVVICPPFPYLFPLKADLGKFGKEHVQLGAQNLHWKTSGAHTGEVSASMLLELGCQYVLVGHSERREAGETDEVVGIKLKQAVSSGLTPILCVGESQGQRQIGKTAEVVQNQVLQVLNVLEERQQLVIAYEPVWAIGTGLSATAEQAQAVHELIRQTLTDRWGAASAEITPILYGGSVKPDNAASFAAQPDIDGALVGGASLNASDFSAIVQRFERG
ncbi:MAG: triose-phosphate isomerase [Bacillus sp. (in: Bacteria)]|nr:triose-phosphate isomerase [Bacillus sp. (in: firmicutes)]